MRIPGKGSLRNGPVVYAELPGLMGKRSAASVINDFRPKSSNQLNYLSKTCVSSRSGAHNAPGQALPPAPHNPVLKIIIIDVSSRPRRSYLSILQLHSGGNPTFGPLFFCNIVKNDAGYQRDARLSHLSHFFLQTFIIFDNTVMISATSFAHVR